MEFGEWELPVSYQSVIAEHKAVRSGVGWFDVSHLGRFELTGPGSRDAIRSLLCNDIDRIEPGRSQYTMILNEEGGIIDDLIVWWWGPDRFWVMPNAANQERVIVGIRGTSRLPCHGSPQPYGADRRPGPGGASRYRVGPWGQAGPWRSRRGRLGGSHGVDGGDRLHRGERWGALPARSTGPTPGRALPRGRGRSLRAGVEGHASPRSRTSPVGPGHRRVDHSRWRPGSGSPWRWTTSSGDGIAWSRSKSTASIDRSPASSSRRGAFPDTGIRSAAGGARALSPRAT